MMHRFLIKKLPFEINRLIMWKPNIYLEKLTSMKKTDLSNLLLLYKLYLVFPIHQINNY